jgi:hypothetical protein
MSDHFKFQNKNNKGLSIQTEAEKLGVTQKYIMRLATTQPQARYFKSLLVLRDLTTHDFFQHFFRLVVDQDERIVSMIEETYKMKKNHEISRLANLDKENIYELIEEYSPITSGGNREEGIESGDGKSIDENQYIPTDWLPRNKKQRKIVNRELCSRDSKE